MVIKFSVTFKKDVHTFSLDPTVTVQELKNQLHELTGVPPELQKLIAKGQMRDEMQLSEVPIVEGSKIMLVGTSQADADKMKVAKIPQHQLASRPVAVTRRMGAINTFDTIGADTVFGSLKVLEGWPNSEQARSILQKLSTDNSIVQVMKKHGWKVGVLSELTPLEYTKLGWNMNRGAEISLRLRFENGFRSYDSIKKVLYHELAHMEVDDHNNEFKALNSLIKRECEAVGPGRKVGEGNSYHQSSSADEEDDEEMEEIDHGGVGYRLGGDETSTPSNGPQLTPSQAAAQAALRRFESAPKPTPPPVSSPISSSPSQPSPASTPTSNTTTITSTTQTSTPTIQTPNNPKNPPSSNTANPPTLASSTAAPLPSTPTTLPERLCPICGLQFKPSETDRQVSQHVNSCLDKA